MYSTVTFEHLLIYTRLFRWLLATIALATGVVSKLFGANKSIALSEL